MAVESTNKVFISWSGSPSKEIARTLRTWLDDVLDHISPWVSDVDIEAGSRGLAEIEEALKDAKAGIIIVTKETMHRPWINFEAGALSKIVGNDPKNRVIPLLVGFDKTIDLTGPLNILQAVQFDEDGVTRLLRSLYTAFGMKDKSEARMKAYWSGLKTDVEAILAEHPIAESLEAPVGPVEESLAMGSSRSSDSKVDEMLGILRAIRDRDAPSRSGGTGGYWGGVGGYWGGPDEFNEHVREKIFAWADTRLSPYVDTFEIDFEEVIDDRRYDVVIWMRGTAEKAPLRWLQNELRDIAGTKNIALIPTSPVESPTA